MYIYVISKLLKTTVLAYVVLMYSNFFQTKSTCATVLGDDTERDPRRTKVPIDDRTTYATSFAQGSCKRLGTTPQYRERAVTDVPKAHDYYVGEQQRHHVVTRRSPANKAEANK